MEIRKELGTFNSKQAKMRSEIKDFENLMDEFRQNNEQQLLQFKRAKEVKEVEMQSSLEEVKMSHSQVKTMMRN